MHSEAILDTEQAVNQALLTTAEQQQLDAGPPSYRAGIRPLGRHMLGLLADETAPESERVGARIILLNGTAAERKTLLLHDLAEPLEPSSEHPDREEPPLHELDSVQALFQGGEVPQSLQEATRASESGKPWDRNALATVAHDLLKSVIDDLPPQECVALIKAAHENGDYVVMGRSADLSLIRSLARKVAGVEHVIDQLWLISEVARGIRLWSQQQFEAMAKASPEQKELFRQTQPTDEIQQIAKEGLLPETVPALSIHDAFMEVSGPSIYEAAGILSLPIHKKSIQSYLTLSQASPTLGFAYMHKAHDQAIRRMDEMASDLKERIPGTLDLVKELEKVYLPQDVVRHYPLAKQILSTPGLEPLASRPKAIADLVSMLAFHKNTSEFVSNLRTLASHVNIAEVFNLTNDTADPTLFNIIQACNNPQLMQDFKKFLEADGVPQLYKDHRWPASILELFGAEADRIFGQNAASQRTMIIEAINLPGAERMMADPILQRTMQRWLRYDLMHTQDNVPETEFIARQKNRFARLQEWLNQPGNFHTLKTIHEANPLLLSEVSLIELREESPGEQMTQTLEALARLPKNYVTREQIGTGLSWPGLITMYAAIADRTEQVPFHQLAAEYLLETGQLRYRNPKWDYTFTPEQLQKAEDNQFAHGSDFSEYVEELSKLPPSKRPLITGLAIELAGGEPSPAFAQLIRDAVEGRLSPADQALIGVTGTGEEAVEGLRQKAVALKTEVYSGNISDETLQAIIKSPFLREVFKGLTSYEASGWGQHDDLSLEAMLKYHMQAKSDSRLEPMPIAYRSSPVVDIAKLHERTLWTEDFIRRYERLATNMQSASKALNSPAAFGVLFDRLENSLKQQIGVMRAKEHDYRDTTFTEEARRFLTQEREALEALLVPQDPVNPWTAPLRSLKGFEANFRKLYRFDRLTDSLQTLVFAWAMRRHPDWQQRARRLASEPTIDDISDVREFVEHIVNRETFAGYFSNKKDANRFKQLVHTRSLEQALGRTQGYGVSSDTVPIQFVPTRGPLMELSGHIADACWANKYDSIAEAMPNMTTLLMKKHPGDPVREKLIGAGLLIETTDANGERLLLLRGINPRENFINHVSTTDFMGKLLTYCQGIAEARRSRLGIVIDYSGGASTNRPVLDTLLRSLKERLSAAKPNTNDTSFNGYDLGDRSYYITPEVMMEVIAEQAQKKPAA